MIGIKAVASYIPEGRIDNLVQAKKFGESEDFIKSKIGALSLPQKDIVHQASDMAAEAVMALVDDTELSLEDIDALVVVTQNGDGQGLPHTAAILQNKLGIGTHVAAFDISLGCSGYVYGLSILAGLMKEAGLKNGVLVTADPYSNVIDRDDRITALLFGDAATASWLSSDGPWKFGQPILQTDGSGAEHLFVRNGKLVMNGRQVFNFASKRVPRQINEWLSMNKVSTTDVDLYCLHQGSSSIVDAISKRFPEVSDRFVNDISATGNTVSSSIPLILEKYVMGKELGSVLLSGFGVGLSWATNLIYRREDC